MQKKDLIELVAKELNCSKAQATSAVNAVVNGIGTALVSDGKLQLVGFGSFEAVNRAARKGKNPRTGEEIEIAASKTVKFKPGSYLKSELND